jgi:hypothetical protein
VAKRVRRIDVDPDRFQAFAPPRPIPNFDGQPLGKLVTTAMTPVNPRPEPSDFFSLWVSSAFACSSRAADLMGKRMREYGELLEGQIEGGDEVLIFNCTNLVNCLDPGRTTWEIGPRSGTRLRVLRYWFRRERLPQVGTLFKLLETAQTEILTIDDSETPELGFVAEAERAGVLGLTAVPLDEFARHHEAMWGLDPRFADKRGHQG